MEHSYEVVSPLSGNVVMSAPVSCRYDPKTELSMLEAGYIIRLNGKRLTKSEIRKGVGIAPKHGRAK